MRISITALLVAVAFASLGGCGQTGPLYMPDEPPPETQPDTPADTTVRPPPGP